MNHGIYEISPFAVIGLRFFSLKPADVRGPGTRDEPLRTSAWEANSPINVKPAVGGGRAWGGDLTFFKNLQSNSLHKGKSF